MNTTLRARLAVLLSTLVLSGIAALPGGLVLCVADGDHVAIERAIELEPCGVPCERRDGAGEPALGDSCTDTPLVQLVLGKSSELRIEPSSWSVPAQIALPVPVAPGARVAASSRMHRGELRALRTIVLRA